MLPRASVLMVPAILLLAACDALFTWPSSVRAVPVFSGLGLVLAAAACVLRWPIRGERCRIVGVAIFGGLLVGLMAVYMLNPTHVWRQGVGLLPVPHVHWLPGTANASATSTSLLFATAALAILGCSLQYSARALRRFAYAVIAGGVAMAAAVIVQRLTPRPFPVFEHTGIFVSENQYAAFANMVFPLALAAAARSSYAAFTAGRLSSPAPFFYAAAGLIAASVYFSRSRAGMVITAALIPLFIVQQLQLRKRYPFIAPPVPRLSKLVVTFIGVVALLGALAVGAKEWRHLSQFGRELSYRAGIVHDTVRIWMDRPWWGVGPGSFASVYPYYQGEAYRDRFIRHAHCEPAEFLAEYGVFGSALLAAAAFALFRCGGRSTPDGHSIPSVSEVEVPAIGLALGGCLLHGLVDFPFRAPLIGLTAYAFAGLLLTHRVIRLSPAPIRAEAKGT